MDKRLQPSARQRQDILEDLFQRNRVRLDARLPAIDIGVMYNKQITMIADQKYRALLDPYLIAAGIATPVVTGYIANVKRDALVRRMAVQSLFVATGIANRDASDHIDIKK